MIKVYHSSHIAGLTELQPYQCRKEDSSRNALFFAPTIRDALMWRGRLFTERRRDPKYLYCAMIDPGQVKVWCDGLRGNRRRWHGEITLGGQIWIYQSIGCEAIEWLAEVTIAG
jgi:hypothetical protein